jgi:hypothetical protein
MDNVTTDLDHADEYIIICDVSDEALEAAAGIDGGRAITWIYCTNLYWHCWPG